LLTIGNLFTGDTTMTKDIHGMTLWTGGDRPVDVDVIVAVRIQGDLPRIPVRAGDWPQVCWRHRTMDDPKSIYNIIAYKLVE